MSKTKLQQIKPQRLRSAQPSPRETFIVRLWQRDVAPADWLGQVQHVHSGETAVIRNLDELTAVVKQLMPTSPSTSTLK